MSFLLLLREFQTSRSKRVTGAHTLAIKQNTQSQSQSLREGGTGGWGLGAGWEGGRRTTPLRAGIAWRREVVL